MEIQFLLELDKIHNKNQENLLLTELMMARLEKELIVCQY